MIARLVRSGLVAVIACLAAPNAALGHSGPPYPIVSDAVRGPYSISIWTDPDATDDGSPGGQFWIVIRPANAATVIPSETRASVSVRPLDRAGPMPQAVASPVRDDVVNQFAGLVMDHEGRFAVQVTVNGPLGAADVDAVVDATYDLRPAPYMLVWYLAPFVLVGILWTRLIVRRRTVRGGRL